MTNQFTPPGFGFVPFGPHEAREMFRQARTARRDLRDQMRAQAQSACEPDIDPTCQTGFGGPGFGPGFGPISVPDEEWVSASAISAAPGPAADDAADAVMSARPS